MFLRPSNQRFRKSKMTKFHKALNISDLPNRARMAFFRPKGQLVPQMRSFRVKRS